MLDVLGVPGAPDGLGALDALGAPDVPGVLGAPSVPGVPGVSAVPCGPVSAQCGGANGSRAFPMLQPPSPGIRWIRDGTHTSVVPARTWATRQSCGS